jgi:hypothetical protein
MKCPNCGEEMPESEGTEDNLEITIEGSPETVAEALRRVIGEMETPDSEKTS